MPTIVLRKHAQPQQISNKDLLNTVKPLEYYEWLKNQIGIIPEQAERQYQKYINDWYKNRSEQLNLQDNSTKIKEDYIALLKKLKIIFRNDEEFDRLTNINFDSQTELKLAIPFFAKKLKEIALYYVSQRESIKNTKLKYNMSGSYNALERILYSHLLQAFTKKDYNFTVQSKDVFAGIPSLSAIKNDFKIEIEELYDMNDYFDKDYSIENNSTGVYDLSTVNPLVFVLEDYIANFYNAFGTNEIPLSALSNPLSPFSICETSDENINEQVLAALGSKYLGNDIWYLTGGYFDWDRKDVTLNLEQGNNFFYWFSGETAWEIPDGRYLNTALSSINWITQGTGGSAYDVSDVIFKAVGNRIVEGAWLMDTETINIQRSMSATMQDGKTFKFPYPGIGTSAEGGDWTGKIIFDTIEPDRRFFPSEKSFNETQKEIEKLYWSNHPSISTVNEIYLQDTDLYNSGAFASNTYEKADKLIVRRNVGENRLNDVNSNGVFTGTLETSWLYDFKKSEIPIKPGENNVYYPLTAYDDPNELFFRYESGDDINLSALDVGSCFAGAIAGDKISNADILIKLNSVCGPELEAAWLQGSPLSGYFQDELDKCRCDGNYKDYYTKWKFHEGVTQPSVSFKAGFDNFIRFVWTGKKVNINDVAAFTGFEHDHSCEYFKDNNYSSILDTNFLNQRNKDKYEKWKKCTCKTVHHSPLGHNKDNFMDYKYPTDFIVKDTQFPSAFSFKDWRGSDGKDYRTSKDRAWFKVQNLLEPDVGWGKGEWQAEDGFFLEPGKTYIYYRSGLNRCGFELPYFVVNHGYCDCNMNNCGDVNCLPTWRKAVLDNNGEWIDAGVISDMILESGFFFTYTHRETNTFSQSILTYRGSIVNSVSSDYITLSAVDPSISEQISPVSYPSNNFLIKIPLTNNNPYWGEASFDENLFTQNKRKMGGKEDFRIVNDYLQVVQPTPSQTILRNDDAIEYKTSDCGGCFVWNQPLNFEIINPIRRWNKILIDNCVKSDILNYLHEQSCSPCHTTSNKCYSECQDLNICGCENFCVPAKIGVTATNIPSDLEFNTELSGIPVFVNYYARNDFEFNFQVIDISNGMPPDGGLWIPPVSTIYSQAELPWMNLINDFNPLVASQHGDKFFSRKELGMFTPQRLATGKYELRNGKFYPNFQNRDSSSYDLIREETYADGDMQVVDTDSTWMKHTYGSDLAGNVILNKHQSFYPYTNNFEMNGKENFGLWDTDKVFTPWDENGEWNFDKEFPKNFRGLYPINCGEDSWFNSQMELSGTVLDWQTDIYGNQYFLYNNEDVDPLQRPSKYSTILMKNANGEITLGVNTLSSIFNKYININFNLS